MMDIGASRKEKGMVWFVGAGSGDPELITVKGRRLVASADLIVYAGSLVPAVMLSEARKDAQKADSSAMTLEETHALMREACRKRALVVRLHTGDPSLYGALREQAALLDRDGIPWAVVPGVTAAFAAAAAAKISFSIPDVCQTLILTRMTGRTRVPPREDMRLLAAHHAALAIYLSGNDVSGVQNRLLDGGLPGVTPVIIAYRVGWPDEIICHTTLEQMNAAYGGLGVTRQTLFLVLPGSDSETRSCLYNPVFAHGFRNAP